MSTSKDVVNLPEESSSAISRRNFIKRAAVAGATTAFVAGSLASLTATLTDQAQALKGHDNDADEIKKRDRDIQIAAQIAEALAVTTYTNIINAAPFLTRLESDDQGYLIAARQEEMSHYLLEQSVTNEPSPFISFYYPVNMFANAQVTLSTLVTLEDAFIAAYLVGVRNFSTPELRVAAARIMGIESNHRTLARLVGPRVASQDGGPIENVTGAQGIAESVDPPNNDGYERTLCWNRISQAVQALLPFADVNAAKVAGFDTSKAYSFEPFTPVLPSALGEFISFKGC
jgi:hypothetical protein